MTFQHTYTDLTDAPPSPRKIQYTHANCELSDDELHRFTLTRSWEHDDPFAAYRVLIYLMLNPSKADGRRDDPTVKSCVRIADYNGYGHIIVGNLFSLRSTDWKVVRDHARDPKPGEWPGNSPEVSDEWLRRILRTPAKHLNRSYVRADVCVAWGAHVLDIPGSASRIRRVMRLVREAGHAKPFCVSTTESDNPGHPLFLSRTTPLAPWAPDQEARAISNAA